jgi:hypothetical protein
VIVQAAPWMHFGWIVERAGLFPSVNFKAIEAVDRDGKIAGMIGYDAWTENSVVMSIALENPACFRSLVKPAFEYPFVQAKRGVAMCTIRASNTRSLELTKHTGFIEAYRIRDGIKVGEDLIVMEMRREDCRWIRPEFRKAA